MAKLSIEFRGGPRQQRQPSHTAYEPVLAWKNYNSSVNHVSHFPYFLEPEECWEDHPTSESERELVRNQTETCHFCRQPEKAQSRRGVASFLLWSGVWLFFTSFSSSRGGRGKEAAFPSKKEKAGERGKGRTPHAPFNLS